MSQGTWRVGEGHFKLREQRRQSPGRGKVWDFLEESMRGSILNGTRSQGRNRSDGGLAGLERWAGPVLCGAPASSSAWWEAEVSGGFKQRGLSRMQRIR